MTVLARPTITIFNAYHLPETLEWLDNLEIILNPTHLTYPLYLSVTVLPKEEKQKIEMKYNSYNFKNEKNKDLCNYIITYMNSVDNSHFIPQFKDHTNFLDGSRNQSFKTACPYYNF